jgi:hypothetical protein
MSREQYEEVRLAEDRDEVRRRTEEKEILAEMYPTPVSLKNPAVEQCKCGEYDYLQFGLCRTCER